MTLFERLAAAREQLERAGINPAEAAVDVDVYVRRILDWDRGRVLINHHAPIPDHLEPKFTEWLTRRERFEPTAYIIGAKEFWGLDFLVTPAVLIPRPETEFIVEATLALARSGNEGAPLRIADIGTGSGCIAVSIAHELRHCSILATDVSESAVRIAGLNAQRHGVAKRVMIAAMSYLDAVAGVFDIVTANPPYVRYIDRRGLSADVLQEPHVALFGGDNGLRHIDAILETVVERLRPGGWLVMEFGFGQEDDVRALVDHRAALRFDHTRADLQGLARTAIIQRQ